MRNHRHPIRAHALRAAALAPASSLLDDLRLFALTFVGGFLFLTVYLA